MELRGTLQAGDPGPDLSKLALCALSVLASDSRKPALRLKSVEKEPFTVARRSLVAHLQAAVLASDHSAVGKALEVMRSDGLTDRDIADLYVPAVARSLGEQWETDITCFSMVTIGCARLQGLLRRLGPEWCSGDAVTRTRARSCLLVVPERAQHTLGAIILAGQLRRGGMNVRLEIGVGPAALRALTRSDTYDVVMISAARGERLVILRQLVDIVNEGATRAMTIIGGSVLDQQSDVLAQTGTDHITNNWQEALRICHSKPLPHVGLSKRTTDLSAMPGMVAQGRP